jgi:pimeloyl-ACP methyl ester carboxylesterase
MKIPPWLKILVILGSLFYSADAFAGYFWWQYSTNGFMNANRIPSGFTINYNYGYRPVTNQSHADTLVLFLPGTGVRTDSYTEFYQNAVNHGYFVMALDWINDHDSTPLCTSNASCEGLLYQQQVDGAANGFFDAYFGPSGSNPGQQDYNSITNRFGFFLKWLMATDASGASQWSQFCASFNANGVCTTPQFSKIIVAGHSQGGMIAWWILKNHGAKKGIALSAPSARMNTASVTPASSAWTPFTTNPSPGDAPYNMYLGAPTAAGRYRVFLNFFDPRYKPGVTVPGEPTSSNPNWVPNNGKNQPGNLVDMGKHETRISADTACDTTDWTQWVTVMDPGDPGSTHGSTAINGAGWDSSAPGFRACVWNFLLDQ